MATTNFTTGTVITSDWANDVDRLVYEGNWPTSAMTSSFNFRNKIINGNFDFWQRGTSLGSGTGERFLADRWAVASTGSTYTVSRQTFTLGQTDVPGEPSYFHRVAVTSVAGASNSCNLFQREESVKTLAGKSAVLTFYAKADAAKNIAVETLQNFGTTGSPSTSVIGISVTTCALTTSWQKFTVPISVPSITGKTLGSDNNDRLTTIFWFDAGSDNNSRTNSLGQQSGTFDIARVQLEEGSVATPFEERPYDLELGLCGRYYEKSFLLTTTPAQNIGADTGEAQWRAFQAGATGNGSGTIPFITRKRASPNITLFSTGAASAEARDQTGSFNCTGTAAASITERSFRIGTTTHASTSVNSVIGIHWTAEAEL